MKFNEKYQQIQRENDDHKLFKAFEEDIRLLISSNSQSVSYQLAYDHVFKLVKQNKETEILIYLDQKVQGLIQQKMQGTDISTKEIIQKLEVCKEIVVRICEVCLFLDINYCQKTLKQSLLKRLNSLLFTALTANSTVIQSISNTAFRDRDSHDQQLEAVLDVIDHIDEKHIFFESYILKNYLQLVKKYEEENAAKAWKEHSLREYLEWCKSRLEKEEKHVWERFAKRPRRQGVDAAVACVYETIVSAYRDKIYQTDQNQLFKVLTLPLLQLFKHGKGKDVQGHIQWFMKVLEKKLNLIATDDNNIFIQNFCTLYEEITALLKSSQSKFEINYRSVFTFEEWINNEKFNIPLRLNLFIDQQFRTHDQSEESFSKKVALVFKLIKEKNIFENTYRQMLVNRLVRSYLTYKVQQQREVIVTMEKECGEEWSDKIAAITELYIKNRDKLIANRKITACEENNLNIGGLVPLIVPDNSWPFGDKNSKISINNQLLNMTQSFQKSYLNDVINERLWWSSKAGTVLLNISFKNTKRLFLVSVDMANLLLYIQKGPKMLASFLCQHGYSIDQIQQAVQTLTSRKLVHSNQQGNDYELSLSDDYAEGQMQNYIQVRSRKLEVKVMEQLKADRKLMIEAILVKIMKTEKMCKREELMQKSAPLVAQRGFKFNGDFVSKSIDRLVDKEFIRDFEDGSLGYIA